MTKNSVTLDRSIFKAERNPLAKVKGIGGLRSVGGSGEFDAVRLAPSVRSADFSDDVASGWENRDVGFWHFFGNLFDRFLHVGSIGKLHHLHLLRRKSFRHMDDIKCFGQFFEVNDLHNVRDSKRFEMVRDIPADEPAMEISRTF